VNKKLVTIALCFAVFSLLAGGCKQGRGERCQVDADCASGLICSHAEPKTCGDGTGDGIDADVPPGDAAPDAP
jgi:hypothetical protein